MRRRREEEGEREGGRRREGGEREGGRREGEDMRRGTSVKVLVCLS